jgi:hypothetical protein
MCSYIQVCTTNLGSPHTSPVVETVALAATPLPATSYKPAIAADVASKGGLSVLQMENVIHASEVGAIQARKLRTS